MTANYLVCNIEDTNKRAEYKRKQLLFLNDVIYSLTIAACATGSLRVSQNAAIRIVSSLM